MPSGSSRYPGYPGHLQRTGLPPEAYPPGGDPGKELGRDGCKNRGGLPKHMQEQMGPSGKADPKLSGSSPGVVYPGSYPPSSGRPPQHLIPPQSDHPPGARGESGTSSREKTQNKAVSIQEQELRALGKTTMTAANFINAIIMRQISCETGMPGTSSASQGKTLWIPGSAPPPDPPPRPSVASCTLWWLALSNQPS